MVLYNPNEIRTKPYDCLSFENIKHSSIITIDFGKSADPYEIIDCIVTSNDIQTFYLKLYMFANPDTVVEGGKLIFPTRGLTYLHNIVNYISFSFTRKVLPVSVSIKETDDGGILPQMRLFMGKKMYYSSITKEISNEPFEGGDEFVLVY